MTVTAMSRGPAARPAEVLAYQDGMADLSGRATRGAISVGLYLVITLAVRTLSMLILARLLTPKDYGVFAMALTVIGVAAVLREGGLSDAAVQSAEITRGQQSTLFWLNVLLGCGFAALCVASASLVAAFYREPTLFNVMIILGTTFVFTGLTVQHRAILLRDMRLTLVGGIDFLSLVFGIGASLVMARAGWGYWSLVGGYLIPSVVAAPCVWFATGWIPGKPASWTKTRDLISYGSTVTVNSLVAYFSGNAEKMLLGRFWGAESVGVYTRAYQLTGIPSSGLDAIGASVVFPALARVRHDPVRLRNYFLTVYTLWVSAALPVAAASALFADDMVAFFLGAQWRSATVVFRLLAPIIVASALTRPFLWLLFANGEVARNLKISLVSAPVMLVAYCLGVPNGPPGVAAAYSVATLLLVGPVGRWSKRDTMITVADIVRAVWFPCAAVLVAIAATIAALPSVRQLGSPLLRLCAGCGLLFSVYVVLLLFPSRRRAGLMDQMRRSGLVGRWRVAKNQES